MTAPLKESWTELYRENGVVLGEYWDVRGSSFVVADELFAYYRLTFSGSDGAFHVGINAAWSDQKPGELASFTPAFGHSPGVVAGDEIAIADNGLLTVLCRQRGASGVDIRVGFTAQLPIAFVPPVRQAIALLVRAAEATP